MELKLKLLQLFTEAVIAGNFNNTYLGPLVVDDSAEEEIKGSTTFLIYIDGQAYLLTFDEATGMLVVNSIVHQTVILEAKYNSTRKSWVVVCPFDENSKLSDLIQVCKTLKVLHDENVVR